MTRSVLVITIALSLAACSAAFLSTPAVTSRTLGKSISQRLTPSLGLRSPLLPAKLAASRTGRNGALDLAAVVKAEYIWIGGRGGGGDDYRSKTRILKSMPDSVEDLPLWNYDGSSTGQAPGEDSEVYLKPVFKCPDPTRAGEAILVLCEMLNPDMTPIPTNTRNAAAKIFEGHDAEEPWYGIEQEYTLFQDGVPLGWPKSGARPFSETSPLYQFGYPGPQGPYYCGVGYDVTFGREIVEQHLDYCLEAGLQIGGTNGEVMPGQWEYQVGPCVGISSGDELHMSRYLLHRVCEENAVVCSFDPKPIPGNWNGAGCHTNFSTKKMRDDGGIEAIKKACDNFGEKHEKHIKLYGVGNERRLTGDCETNSIDSFKYGVADRGASIRIPRFTDRDGKGYLEDRRPASNMDPYVVTALIFDTAVLKGDTTLFDSLSE